MEVKDLVRGDMVMATKHLDVKGANVRPGTLGVVFEEANAYKDGGGPVVRWMNCGICNIYQGDVVKVPLSKYEIVDVETGEILHSPGDGQKTEKMWVKGVW